MLNLLNDFTKLKVEIFCKTAVVIVEFMIEISNLDIFNGFASIAYSTNNY